MGREPRACGIVSMMTDFGLDDGHAGVMTGVMVSIDPSLRFIDITHKVKPQHVAQAALLLKNSFPFFPRGTVHLAVVDPGVGGVRRPIAVRTPDHFFVGPDNGLFTLVYRNVECFEVFHLNRPEFWLSEVSATFHGRDLFAPVAARLAGGGDIEAMGTPVDDPRKLPILEPKETDRKIVGKIIYCDNFGNLITNIGGKLKDRILGHSRVIVKAGGRPIHGVVPSYDSVDRHQLLAIFGSSGLLEVSVNLGSAQRFLQVEVGDSVEVLFK